MRRWLRNFVDGYRGLGRVTIVVLIIAALLILFSLVVLILRMTGVIQNPNDMQMFRDLIAPFV